jgi:hypothetical protein
VGGQIDSSPLPAGTQSNFLQGIRFKWFGDNHFVNRLVLEQDLVQFIEVNPGSHILIPDGYGSYSRLHMHTSVGNFSLAYWRAYNFTAPHGEVLFHSNSDFMPDFYLPERKVLSIKYQYQYRINDFLNFALRIEPYYQVHSGRLDHSFGVLLMVDKNFFLARAYKSMPDP